MLSYFFCVKYVDLCTAINPSIIEDLEDQKRVLIFVQSITMGLYLLIRTTSTPTWCLWFSAMAVLLPLLNWYLELDSAFLQSAPGLMCPSWITNSFSNSFFDRYFLKIEPKTARVGVINECPLNELFHEVVTVIITSQMVTRKIFLMDAVS